LALVRGLTGRLAENVWLTVVTETPAIRATSTIVAIVTDGDAKRFVRQ
jgi:hypothetical protein